jgi:hypothetical protein
MTFFCTVAVETLNVVLSVQPYQSGDWTWTLRIVRSNVDLGGGVAISKDAAQVAAQRAFEGRLHRAGLDRCAPERYQWKKQIGG